MKPDWLRGLYVFVSGMLASLLFAEVFLISVNPASVVLTMSLFILNMTIQKRYRPQPGERDQGGEMAAWVLPAVFVLGMASCATVGWITYLWASEIAHFIDLTLRA